MKLSQYQGRNGCSLASWLRVVSVRMVLNHIRTGGMNGISRKGMHRFLEDISSRDREELAPLALLEQAEQIRLLHDNIRLLPPRERLLLKLHIEQDFTLEETADELGISIQNAYTLKHRAIQRLKCHLTGED